MRKTLNAIFNESGLNDDGKLKNKYTNKRVNAEKEGLEFLLSPRDLIVLMKKAKIKSSDWGFSNSSKMVLARYNDTGNYVLGNCRFITQYENSLEKKLSEKAKLASSKNAKLAAKVNKENFKNENYRKEHSRKTREGCLKYLEDKTGKTLDERIKERQSKLDSRYTGKHNSQYGTKWITNGKVNRKIKKEDKVPKGFWYGRITGV